MKVVIGLVGEIGSGKETFTNYLKEIAKDKKISRIRSSDILSETLKLWDISKTRENLQNLAIIMDNHYGLGTLSHAVYYRISQDDSDIIIFDGVRWNTDVDLIRKFPKNFLVYITASLKTRFQRIKDRKEKKGEGTVSFEQFLKEEKAKTETFIKSISKKADYTIQNNSSFENFQKEVKKFNNQFLMA